MQISRSKRTKRFNFKLNRNTKSHQTGANIVTIESKDYDTSGRGYSFQTTDNPGTLTMSVREAKALLNFLNQHLSS